MCRGIDVAPPEPVSHALDGQTRKHAKAPQTSGPIWWRQPKTVPEEQLALLLLSSRGRGVITMDMIERIRHLYARKNKSERETTRMKGSSRNTAAKWLHG